MRDKPAFPIPGMDMQSLGLTKRELFAVMAMQSLISVPDKSFENRGKDGVPILAGFAVEYADALIKALEQDNG